MYTAIRQSYACLAKDQLDPLLGPGKTMRVAHKTTGLHDCWRSRCGPWERIEGRGEAVDFGVLSERRHLHRTAYRPLRRLGQAAPG